MKLVLVTGLSGAGKSVCLRTLEDIGYEAIDNLPLSFIPVIAAAGGQGRKVVIGADTRGRDFSAERFAALVRALSEDKALEFELVFMDCDDEVLVRRFTETRRRHPLALDRPVEDGIAHERALLSGIRALANRVIDTSQLPVPDLRRLVEGYFAGDDAPPLAISITSFSYKGGLPREADLVFDVRFLSNPFYIPELRELTGLDAAVGEHIARDPGFAEFFAHLTGLVLPLLPQFEAEGKRYLTIAIGCTGGQHRSVYTAKRLGDALRGAGYAAEVRHRELARR